jgi:two-component system LytT family sensor kinase
MIQLKSVNIKTIFAHAIFWGAVWFFFVYFFSYNSTDSQYIFWFSSALVPVTMIVTYVIVYQITPNYLLQKKYFKFALYLFYTTVFTAHSIVIIIYACLILILKYNIDNVPPMSKNVVFVFILVYLVVGLVSLVDILNYNFKTVSKNKELQNKILESQIHFKDQELLYLKKQIHPHFLFNTLNTIYGFALKQSKDTPDIILKLSNLLDYILYQVSKPKVSLKEEILHIQEYIELEKIRFQDSLSVTFEPPQIEESVSIAPMLMIPFVENAFKHGAIDEGFLQIEITVTYAQNRLSFVVKNTFAPTDEHEEKQPGIGLMNIRKRLELHHPDNHELNIMKTEKWFILELIIPNLENG